VCVCVCCGWVSGWVGGREREVCLSLYLPLILPCALRAGVCVCVCCGWVGGWVGEQQSEVCVCLYFALNLALHPEGR